MASEITVQQLSEKLNSEEKFVLLDVRELVELRHAKLEDSRLEVLPLSRLAHEGAVALPESISGHQLPVYVICHHGNRSMQVTNWLASQGHPQVYNVTGGIDEYARKIDPSVGSY